MRLLRILLLLVIQGHFSISQEATVRGTEGGTLTAYCEYSPGWESYKKWWCRGKYWNSCRMLVKTTGSEQLVKKGRASIQDNHSRHTITMTLENLWYDDADIYWCGIERTGSDLGYKFSMVVDPAPDPTDFPTTVPRPTMASHTLLPSTQGLTSSQPVINPGSRLGTLVSSVAAQNPPAWILLVPLFLGTLQWLCQG
ncbi:CMRF35-like molecule 1 isoform X1 [Canis lupus familiaris]|uniref:CMRF35-like molecule 1 isoform X1 n=1 Tax=Canis lupus familiaris TaxID=9615 RepID=UPI001234C75A|nr:CMRF35-like molecule 1 isoform X1 [Canis lupus familiaris]